MDDHIILSQTTALGRSMAALFVLENRSTTLHLDRVDFGATALLALDRSRNEIDGVQAALIIRHGFVILASVNRLDIFKDFSIDRK